MVAARRPRDAEVHATAPEAELVPEEQAVHAKLLDAAAYLPAAHEVQAEAPDAAA